MLLTDKNGEQLHVSEGWEYHTRAISPITLILLNADFAPFVDLYRKHHFMCA